MARVRPLRLLHRPLPRSVRLATQFFVSHGVRHGLGLLARRNWRRLLHRPAAEPLLATPFDLYPRHAPPAVHPFDRRFGVDTSGFHPGADLSGPAFAAMVWNTAYYGIAPSVFDRALALAIPVPPASPPDWSRFTFVDLGCGKGRALLLASRHPFLRIVGVELDAHLAAIARSNLQVFHAPWQLCHALEAVHADATTVTLPHTPILLYLYHPFLSPALRAVLRRLERSLREHPRELWLVYINPEALTVFNSFPFLREVIRTTLPLHPEDALPDRLGSTQEEVAIFHFSPR